MSGQGHRAQNLNGDLIEPHTCIFPILKEIAPGNSQLVGTGFFITRFGHFVTAKHVILDVVDVRDEGSYRQHGFIHALHFVEGAKALVRHITRVSFHNTWDVAVGKMDFHVMNDTGQPLVNMVPRFTTETPREGSPVVTYAYPESDPVFGKGTASRFVPNYYSGEFLEESDKPRDSVIVAWPHFVTSINLKGGASGGPVFDEKGRVFGINCVGGLDDRSYMARVSELLPLIVPDCPVLDGKEQWTVLDLVKIGQITFDPRLS